MVVCLWQDPLHYIWQDRSRLTRIQGRERCILPGHSRVRQPGVVLQSAGWLILDESMNGMQAFGSVLIHAGIYLA